MYIAKECQSRFVIMALKYIVKLNHNIGYILYCKEPHDSQMMVFHLTEMHFVHVKLTGQTEAYQPVINPE